MTSFYAHFLQCVNVSPPVIKLSKICKNAFCTICLSKSRFKRNFSAYVPLMLLQHLPQASCWLKHMRSHFERPHRLCWLKSTGLMFLGRFFISSSLTSFPKFQLDMLDLHTQEITLRGWWDVNRQNGGIIKWVKRSIEGEGKNRLSIMRLSGS